MKPSHEIVAAEDRANRLRNWLEEPSRRLGHITSIDGSQLITLVLNTETGTAHLWETPLEGTNYHSLTAVVPQSHWFERTLWDMFGLVPEGHPRLKHNLLHEPYPPDLLPLSSGTIPHLPTDHRIFHAMDVEGDGIYEIPVGPIHAGIIEPGHFRFSCLGEVIFNLEIRLGYVHRGIEKRLCEVKWQNQRFVAEAAASDSAVAYSLANAVALESICDVEISERANFIRSIALEIERTAMHISDLGGLAGDIGFLAIAATLSRLRGSALRLGELLSGSRLQRGFICPGGTSRDPSKNLTQIQTDVRNLKKDLAPVFDFFLSNQVALDRMQGIGKVSHRLASDFALVGVAGRASGIEYDARRHFSHGAFPEQSMDIAVESQGDVFARANVRVNELQNSLQLIDKLIETLPDGVICSPMPEALEPNQVGLSVVEAHRGELIHLVFTDAKGKVVRYAVKDPSVNNWTGLAIAVRNNLVSDFPLCNKSFSLSYSGHDL